MEHTFQILVPDKPTQYPHQMAKESTWHRVATFFSPDAQILDYFATIKPAVFNNPAVFAEECGNTNGNVNKTTSCPSDHVPIYMDYVFKEIEIRVIVLPCILWSNTCFIVARRCRQGGIR